MALLLAYGTYRLLLPVCLEAYIAYRSLAPRLWAVDMVV